MEEHTIYLGAGFKFWERGSITYKRPSMHRMRSPKGKERFISLKWGNKKLSLNYLREWKSKTTWVMCYIDHKEVQNVTPFLLL